MADPPDRREWGAFLDDLVHELRAPLTAIGGYAMLLAEDEQDLPQPVRRPLEIIAAQSERISAQLAILLDIARLWSGRRRLDARRLDVSLVVRGAAQRHKVAFASSGPYRIRADRTYLDRALDILIDNALRHGVPPISAIVARSAAGCSVTVTDAGPGIALERVPYLGRRPFMAGADETRGTGTGLSLVLAAAVAEAHGGTLGYEREDGETRMVLELGGAPSLAVRPVPPLKGRDN